MLEAVVAVGSGVVARSAVLVGFGLDSMIECAAAGVLLRRLRLERRGIPEARVHAEEIRVRRFVGVTFFALAAYVVFQAAWVLWFGDAPAESPISRSPR